MDQRDLPALIERGLELVAERRRASPDAAIYVSIERQLEYMKKTVEEGARPTDELLDRLTLGIYAAREFETSDPTFADVRFAVEYLYKRYPGAV